MNHDPDDAGRTQDEPGPDEEPTGAEVGMSEEGSTFEPEEDPEGHAG